jgi:hypothetical protein
MPDSPSPPSEHQKWVTEIKREDAQRAFDLHSSRLDQMNEAAIKAGDAALRAGLLINGGAAVSVLAFIGNLATKEPIAGSQLSRVASSLEIFAAGVFAAVVGMGLSYLTHLSDAEYRASLKWKWVGDLPVTEDGPASKRIRWFRIACHVLAVSAFLVCIGCFIGGIVSVSAAIERLAH